MSKLGRQRRTAATRAAGTPTSPGTVTFDEAYDYDARSNRIELDDQLVAGVQQDATFNLADQLTQVVTPGGTDTYSYDEAGNQLTGNSLTLAYNDRGQMTSATPSGGSAQAHVYAGNGNDQRLEVGNLDITPSLRGVQSFDDGTTPLETSRSMMAAQRRGSVKVRFHSENGLLVATAIEARSSRSVMTWNRSSAPRRRGGGSQVRR